MSFASPAWLVALALIPLAAALYVAHERRGRRRTAAFAAPALMPAVVPRAPGWRRHAPVAAYGVAAAVLAVALARPQVTVAVPVERASVVLVFDRSGSMLARDVQPSRLAAAQRAAATFLDQIPRAIRVGAVAYNQSPQALQSPTRDRTAVREALAAIRAAGSTATGDGILTALSMISAQNRPGAKPPPAAIVLLSDGKSVRGSDPLAAARRAAEQKVPIYTVALGTPQGTIESRGPNGTTRLEPVPPDPATLARIAEITDGRTFNVQDAGRLEEVYDRLGSQVATERRPREITAAFAGGALLLIAAAAGASLRWFGRMF